MQKLEPRTASLKPTENVNRVKIDRAGIEPMTTIMLLETTVASLQCTEP